LIFFVGGVIFFVDKNQVYFDVILVVLLAIFMILVYRL